MKKKTVFWNGLLRDNPLTPETNDYIFEMESGRVITLQDVAALVVQERSEFKTETILDILQCGLRLMRGKAKEGYIVQTDLVYVYPRVKGVWVGENAQYNPQVHKITVDCQPSPNLRADLEEVGARPRGVAQGGPVVGSVTDTWSGEMDGIITPDEELVVSGTRLRISGEKPGVGIFLVSEEDETKRTMVMSRRLTMNNPSELRFRLPQLTPGNYWLEVVTQFAGGITDAKEPRTCRFGRILTVLEPEP